MRPEQDRFLEQLYRVYYGKITSFALAAVQDRSIAEELAQDTFQTAVLRIDVLMAHPNPGGWLMQTAKYKIKEYQRQSTRDLRRLISLSSGGLQELPVGRGASGEPEAAAGEALERVRRELTPEEYRLFERLILEGASHPEAAGELGISLAASYKRLERIRKKLQKMLR